MRKYVLAVILLAMSSFLFAEVTAVVKEVNGKVEIKSSGGSWKRASAGMKISKGDYISTGFNSQAVLLLGDSQVIVKQLTRMELEKLVEKEGTVSTSLNLRVGRVRAEVKSAKGLKQNFILKSPISTAAVRGTVFEYDGRNLTVYRGSVAFTNSLGQERLIGAASRIRAAGFPDSTENLKARFSQIIPTTMEIPQNVNMSDIIDMLSDMMNVTLIIKWNGDTMDADTGLDPGSIVE